MKELKFLIVFILGNALVALVWGLPKLQGSEDPQYVKEIVRYAKSAEIRTYLNESCDPCKNFYNFACGNYYHLHEPTASALQSNVFYKMSRAMNSKFENELSRNATTDTKIDKKVKWFYESCMNVNQTTDSYKEKLLKIINEFGEMPVLKAGNWQETNFNWLETVAQIAYKYGNRIIMGYFIQVDIVNKTQNRLCLLPQDIPLDSNSMYIEKRYRIIRSARKERIAENLELFLGVQKKLAEETAKEIFEFESLLFTGHTNVDGDDDYVEYEAEEQDEEADDEEWRSRSRSKRNADFDPNILLFTVDEIHFQHFPVIDIKHLLNISLGELPSEKIYDLISGDLGHIMRVINAVPKRTLANYIFFYLLEDFMLQPSENHHKKQTLCLKKTKIYFSEILDNMVYRSFTTNQTEADIQNMWQTIKASFRSVLQSDKLTWMAPKTRQYAVVKLDAIRFEINSYADKNFTKDFGHIIINNQDYVENLKSIKSQNAIGYRAKLKEPPQTYVDAREMSFTPVYISTENQIKVPVSLLQPYYLWSDAYPNALKFATLGFLVAHELIHAFDETGRSYDKTGKKLAWWDKDASDYFRNHIKCFAHQYESYRYEGSPLPPLDTQSENIADNGGLRLAYEAYIHNLNTYQKMELELLPRLQYSNRQLFFISYSQLWCTATHRLLRKFEASMDKHVPDKFRVIGPLSNFDEFSKEFKCPLGSPMNPRDKCIIY